MFKIIKENEESANIFAQALMSDEFKKRRRKKYNY